MVDVLVRMGLPMLILFGLMAVVFTQIAFQECSDEWEWEDHQLQVLQRRQADKDAALSRMRDGNNRGKTGDGAKSQSV